MPTELVSPTKSPRQTTNGETSRISDGNGNGNGNGHGAASGAGNGNGSTRKGGQAPSEQVLTELLEALRAAKDGDFTLRLSTRRSGVMGEIASMYNELMSINAKSTKELVRVARVIGREGRMTERLTPGGAGGSWAASNEAINALIDDLVRPTTEVARVIAAVAEGDLSQKMALKIEGQPV
ncbi:MAG: hypothetical protein QOG64_1519, partial [Acidimicrobiaceae bacterium]|nr:hypothetical protein [Acidimicrobiaceae bacterium]